MLSVEAVSLLRTLGALNVMTAMLYQRKVRSSGSLGTLEINYIQTPNPKPLLTHQNVCFYFFLSSKVKIFFTPMICLVKCYQKLYQDRTQSLARIKNANWSG